MLAAYGSAANAYTRMADPAAVDSALPAGRIKILFVYDRVQRSTIAYEFEDPIWPALVSLSPFRKPSVFSGWMMGAWVRHPLDEKDTKLLFDGNHTVVAYFDGMAEQFLASAVELKADARNHFTIRPSMDGSSDFPVEFSRAQSVQEIAKAAPLTIDRGMLTRLVSGSSTYRGHYENDLVRADFEVLARMRELSRDPDEYRIIIEQVSLAAKKHRDYLLNFYKGQRMPSLERVELKNVNAAMDWAARELNEEFHISTRTCISALGAVDSI